MEGGMDGGRSSSDNPKPTAKKKERANLQALLKGNDDEVNAEIRAMLAGSEYHMDTTEAPRPVKSKKKKESSKSKAPKVSSTTIEELENAIKQQARTSEEKYKVLDARDKLMRLQQEKTHNLKSTATKGTCPDMCPEKERLMREFQRQVAPYEALYTMDSDEYRIDHAIAIKQYSRSSADQEEPMPHDLRPVKSLQMTMSYLLHEIADMCENDDTNLAEWFHFLWDRTRGIRKDITQQELCCVNTVALVEQCARFHILCSERLCAEEPSVFDKKINTENLTKCLQTLKYMYHDLRIKGITCENEAEFRGYIILLNLNNGSFWSDLQHLPIAIQKSPEVKFALKIYSAVNFNNYSKFFRLVKGATYLNACILLRYFNQVRVKALSIMVKAYCTRTPTSYPLQNLIDLLGFEDENEAYYVCEQVGVVSDNDRRNVKFDRQNFALPMTALEQNRALSLIENKRIELEISIGECIAGGELPARTYQHHEPHNSFSSDGHLLQASMGALDQGAERFVNVYDFDDDIDSTVESKPGSSYKLNQRSDDRNSDNSLSSRGIFAKPADLTDFKWKKPLAKVEPTQSAFKATREPSAAPTTSVFFTPSNAASPANMFPTTASQAPSLNAFTPPASSLPSTNVFNSTAFTSIANSNASTNIFSVSKNTFPSTSPFLSQSASYQRTFPDSSAVLSNNAQTSTSTSASQGNSIFAVPGKTFPNSSSIFSTASASNVNSPFGLTSTTDSQGQGDVFKKPLSSSTIFSSFKPPPTEATSKTDKSAIATDNSTKDEETLRKELERKRRAKEEEENRRQLELKKQEEQRKKEQRIAEETEVIYSEIEETAIREIAGPVVKSGLQLLQKSSEETYQELLNKEVQRTCCELLNEEIEFQEKLHQLTEKSLRRLAAKYWNMWRVYVRSRKVKRDALDCTPVWMPKYDANECAKLLYTPQQNLVIENMRRKRHRTVESEEPRKSLAPVEFIVYAGIKENFKSLQLVEAVPSVYWKLVISWPLLENRLPLARYRRIMNDYLSPENYSIEPIIKVYRPNSYETISICIRHFEGLIQEQHLIGTDAILFIAAASEDVNFVNKRLSRTILSRQKLMPVPVIFLIFNDADVEFNTSPIIATLENFVKSGFVSEYSTVSEKIVDEKRILRVTQSSVLWLAINKSPVVPLEMDYLHKLCSDCLTDELWMRIIGHVTPGSSIEKALGNPKTVIDLHNEAVAYLIDIISDPESLMYTDFAPEFKNLLDEDHECPCDYKHFDSKWKTQNYRERVESAMNGFILPHWRFQWPIADALELHGKITTYCQETIQSTNYRILSGKILNKLFSVTDGTKSTFVNVLVQLMKEVISYLDKDLKVVYNKNYIKHFQNLPWWLNSTTYIKCSSQAVAVEDITFTEQQESMQIDNDDEFDMENEDEFISTDTFCKDTREAIDNFKSTSSKLDTSIEEQRKRNQLFQEQLQKALLN